MWWLSLARSISCWEKSTGKGAEKKTDDQSDYSGDHRVLESFLGAAALFAFHEHDVADDQRKNRYDGHATKQRRPESFQELDGRLNNRIGHRSFSTRPYRSTSPSTISIVPMIATTSATRCPRTMRSNACKLMKEGGRMCTRYGMTVPSLTT